MNQWRAYIDAIAGRRGTPLYSCCPTCDHKWPLWQSKDCPACVEWKIDGSADEGFEDDEPDVVPMFACTEWRIDLSPDEGYEDD